MTLRKKLIIVLVIKLIVIFVLLRLVFFPDFLKSRYSTDKERSDYVKDQLIRRK